MHSLCGLLIHILAVSVLRMLYHPFVMPVSSQDMLHLEAEVKNLHAVVDQIQVTLASPDLNRLSLREQLTQRQVKTSNPLKYTGNIFNNNL